MSAGKVLLLKMNDEDASGANLTVANHVVFVHPLLEATRARYEACRTQAIGRVRRYGQLKTVRVYDFLAEDTIDSR